MCQAITYYSDAMGRGAPIQTHLFYEITGTKTIKAHDANAALVSFDAISNQATIDNFLGTTNEFLQAAFDTTPMGTDALAFIFNFGGQIQTLECIRVTIRSSTGLSSVAEITQWGSTSAMGTTLANGIQQGANGNAAVRIVSSGLDSLNAGQIEVTIVWRSK